MTEPRSDVEIPARREPKKPYTRPELTEHGKLHELTLQSVLVLVQ